MIHVCPQALQQAAAAAQATADEAVSRAAEAHAAELDAAHAAAEVALVELQAQLEAEQRALAEARQLQVSPITSLHEQRDGVWHS